MSPSAGGAATTAGTTFQEDVAAFFAVLILAEQSAHRPLSLPANTTISDIIAETTHPVDDLKVSTSTGGQLFLQVKTAPKLSKRQNSELASACHQFVRQYLHGYSLPGQPRRSLDHSLDRLVLLVGKGAARTLTHGLGKILDAVRSTQVGTSHPEVLAAQSNARRESLEILNAHIRRCWETEKNAPITEEDLLSILRLVHILPLDLSANGSDLARAKDLLRQSVLSDATQADFAWGELISVCRTFGPNRTGGDRAYFCQELTTLGFALQATPSYQNDIAKVRQFTEQNLRSLRRLSCIESRGGELKIERPVVEDLKSFAAEGHTLVIGEPGAGKSGCLHDVAQLLRDSNADVVLLAVDLRTTERPLLLDGVGLTPGRTDASFLQNWTGPGTAFLIIDALDAARSEYGLHSICDELARIQELAPRWRIVASIREFDLQHSRDVQRLFAGVPHHERRNTQFTRVRHLAVARLNDEELAQIQRQSQEVGDVLAGSSDVLHALICNPFNLRLLCELIDNHVTADRLTAVRTQIGLLHLYWEERVLQGSAIGGKEAVINACVNEMVSRRSLTLSKQDAVRLCCAENQREALERLLSDNVLSGATLGQLAGAAESIAFSHNILFDYAVARVWLEDLREEVLRRLEQPDNQDLLLAIRPSLIFAFQRLWCEPSDTDHHVFWERALAFESAANMRLIGKIIAGTVAAEEYRVLADIAWLVEQAAATPKSSAARLMGYVTSAAIALHDGRPERHPFYGEGAPEWMKLAAALSRSCLTQCTGGIRAILLQFFKSRKANLTPEQAEQANEAGRNLAAFAMSKPGWPDAIPVALDTVCRTVTAAPAQSVESLRVCLLPEQLRDFGHQTLRPIAEALPDLVDSDPSFSLDVVKAVFQSSAEKDDYVPGGDRILPLQFRKIDMLRAARRGVAERFPSVIRKDPLIALEMLIIALRATGHYDQTENDQAGERIGFNFLDRDVSIETDNSYIWATGLAAQHEDWHMMLAAFRQALCELAGEPALGDRLHRILEYFRDRCEMPVLWNGLLEAAVEAPATLGVAAKELLFASSILGEPDTRLQAGKLLTAVYRFLSPADRARIEQTIMRMAESSEKQCDEFCERRSDRMLGCLPLDLIATGRARKRRCELDENGGAPRNDPDFRVDFGFGPSVEDRELARAGISLDRPENKRVYELIKELRQLRPDGSEKPPADGALQDIASKLHVARDLVEAASTSSLDAKLARSLWDELVRCCNRLAESLELVRGHAIYEVVRSILLEAAKDPHPEHHAEDDEQWDRGHAGWGSPIPRIEAADGLMKLAARPDALDQEIRTALANLARDPVPAVRHHIASRCICIRHASPEFMWELIDYFALQEQRLQVLLYFVSNVLLPIQPSDDERVGPHVHRIYDRIFHRSHAEELRAECTTYFVGRVVWANDAACVLRLDRFIEEPTSFGPELSQVARIARDLLTFEHRGVPEAKCLEIRKWICDYLTRCVTRIIRVYEDLTNQHRDDTDWTVADRERLNVLHQVADAVATEVYFASDPVDTRQPAPGSTETNATLSPEQLERFSRELEPLFEVLCRLPFVDAAYRVLKTLQELIATDPPRIFLHTARLLKNATGPGQGIQFESLATERVVAIIEQYLAEYRGLFRDDSDLRNALLDVLDIFVEVGWPQATRLTYRLDEVFR